MSLVLDASATMAWIYPGEATIATQALLAMVVERGAWVPSLWRLETANVLGMGIRRGRHDAAFRDSALLDLSRLSITTDLETDRQAWSDTLGLADLHRLSVYDAAYLELAMRRGLPLATLDGALRTAARAAGVSLVLQ